MYRVYSSLRVILQRDSQDKSPTGQYSQLKTGRNLIFMYMVRNWAGGKLPSVSLNSSTELAVVAVVQVDDHHDMMMMMMSTLY
jgi:crotonobetainyl-CoA:carnitine CoA-transferase CaiB-like acyl-CoA transferase